MLAFQWNALRIGDSVLVHDDRASSLEVHEGVVAIVESHRGGANGIGIRIDPSRDLVRPRRHAVHQAPLDRTYRCWRCDMVEAQRAAPPRAAAA